MPDIKEDAWLRRHVHAPSRSGGPAPCSSQTTSRRVLRGAPGRVKPGAAQQRVLYLRLGKRAKNKKEQKKKHGTMLLRRYRGLAKNRNLLSVAFALADLCLLSWAGRSIPAA